MIFLYYLCFSLITSTLFAKCEPPRCVEGFQTNLVGAYTFPDGAQIYIHECGSEEKVRFYRIEFFNFYANEIIRIDPIESITESKTVVEVSKCGDASVTIYPIKSKRSFMDIDFDFWRHDNHAGLSASKYLPGQFGSKLSEIPTNSNERVLIINPSKSN